MPEALTVHSAEPLCNAADLVKINLSEQGGVVFWHPAYNLKPIAF